MTTQRKHTPGPWEWQKFGDQHYLTGQHGMRPIVLGTVPLPQPRDTDHDHDDLVLERVVLSSRDDKNDLLRPLDPEHPDARLIRAAPDLLRQCMMLYALSNMGAGDPHPDDVACLLESQLKRALPDGVDIDELCGELILDEEEDE